MSLKRQLWPKHLACHTKKPFHRCTGCRNAKVLACQGGQHWPSFLLLLPESKGVFIVSYAWQGEVGGDLGVLWLLGSRCWCPGGHEAEELAALCWGRLALVSRCGVWSKGLVLAILDNELQGMGKAGAPLRWQVVKLFCADNSDVIFILNCILVWLFSKSLHAWQSECLHHVGSVVSNDVGELLCDIEVGQGFLKLFKNLLTSVGPCEPAAGQHDTVHGVVEDEVASDAHERPHVTAAPDVDGEADILGLASSAS